MKKRNKDEKEARKREIPKKEHQWGIMKNFMTQVDNTIYLMNKKNCQELKSQKKREKKYILEKIGITNFHFLLNICEQVNACVIIDRKIDMITPFCTPFTYEGLIDHLFTIDNLQIEIPRYIIFNDESKNITPGSQKLDNTQTTAMKVRVKLKSTVDVLYNDIKNLSQNEIGIFLHKKASEIQNTYKEKDELRDIEQINKYMRKFKEKQYEHNSLSTHVNIASFILNTIKKEHNFNKLKLEDEIMQLNTNTNKSSLSNIVKQIKDLIYKNEDIYEVYRILCLFSIITNGFNENYLNEIKKDIIEQYGIGELTRLHKLHSCNILKYQPNLKFLWNNLKNNFNLLTTQQSGDISYVCNGYAPLTVRLIEYMNVLQNNIQIFPEVFNLLNGPTLDIVQNSVGYEHVDRKLEKKTEKKKYVILFYAAGITYVEIAAIRKLNEKNRNYHYLIFTTEILNSKKILQSMNS